MMDIKSGLFPATTFVRNDLMIDTGQLQAKHSNIKISQILKFILKTIDLR
jgi:hypothetical protein